MFKGQMPLHCMENLLMSKLDNIIILTGPTGVGKTNISIKIAQYIPEIEIISADSMQVYKYLNIGTDKPKYAILNKHIHHCIDLVEPSVNYDVMQYAKQAEQCIENILYRDKKPLIVGGTGLYIKSLIKPIFDGPGRNQNIRNKLAELAKKKGNSYLFNQIAKYDPEYSNKISANDTKRIIRALEVFYLTGKPLTYFHKNNNLSKTEKKYNYYIICIHMNRKKLYYKINERVEQMLNNGLIEETNEIIEKYKYKNINILNSMQGLGYKQVILYLKGKISKEESVEMIKKETRNFAKRQLSWFRNQIPVDCWINLDDYKDIQGCVEKIISIMKGQGY
jgi:tRNA dimethylallyltransferase